MTAMRTEISFKLVCSQCGETLECYASTKERNCVHFGSAYKAEASLAIKPCDKCMAAAKEPARLMRQALGLMKAD
jgi:hypothetical protein